MAEAGLAPTRMTASPGVTPVFFLRASTRSRHSCRMLAATSLPSMTLATMKYLCESDVGRGLPYEGANNNINDLAASEKSVEVCGRLGPQPPGYGASSV